MGGGQPLGGYGDTQGIYNTGQGANAGPMGYMSAMQRLKLPEPMLHRGDNFFNGGTPLQNPEQVYGGGGLGSNPDLNDTYKYQLLTAGKMFGGPSGAGGFNLF